MSFLKKKIEGAVRGGAIGDSMGLAVETKSREEIAKTIGSVGKMMPIKTNTFFANAAARGKFKGDLEKSGYISDDTILTLAGLQSLINKRKIDLRDLFDEHSKFVEKFGETGFGKGTLTALEEIKKGIYPLQAGQHSRGNGVMMKQFPYALHFTLATVHPATMDIQMEKIAKCTHVTPVAKLASILHNRTLVNLLHQSPNSPINWEKLLNELYTKAQKYEESESYKIGLRDKDDTASLADVIHKLIIQYKAMKAGNPYSLEKILETYKLRGDKRDARYGFHVASTFGFVYGIFLQNQNRQGLLDAINIGEDTDTQAAIIGNMIGAYKGEFYDKSLIDQLQNKEEIATILNKTIDAFLK